MKIAKIAKTSEIAKQVKSEKPLNFCYFLLKKLGYAKLFSRAGAKDLEVLIQFKIIQMIWFKNRYKLVFCRLLVNYKEFYI